ncbi:MAG: 2-methylcitrate dehydratase [Rhodospirillaceae bacterium]|nr:2-methylcitrate dehydratase [Rhodospirillaceae bacterium]|tara:strand:- start:559 stop:1908 length:1350 start_codon:yes stop_codon:yes gene_type:complete
MISETFSAYAVNERNSTIQPEVLHAAKRCFIDWFSATTAGGVKMPAIGLQAAFAEDMDRGMARIIPTGRRATMRTATLINAAASHTVEFDDVFGPAAYHPGTPTTSTAFSVADHLGADGLTFLRAIIIGYEISTRIAEAMGRPHYEYWHTTATNGSYGSLFSAGTLLELDEKQFVHGLGSAGTMAAGLQQAFREDCHGKPIHGSHAAGVGLMAAQVAKNGVTGAKKILDGPVGFGMAMSSEVDWAKSTEGLGKSYNITEITVKNHGCCGHTFPAIDAALTIKKNYNISHKDIMSVKIGMAKSTVAICGGKSHQTFFEGQFSLAFVVATAFVKGRVRLNAFEPEALTNPIISNLAEKCKVYIDDQVDKAFPLKRMAHLTVKLRNNETIDFIQETRKGAPDDPMSDEELEDKYFELVSPEVDLDVAQKLLDDIWRIETCDNIQDLYIARNR